ncbi:MAG: DUF1003 domain-containing protein [Myxococcota bacterium]|nr:DUF1003 domain-containing protein [Myxococcota bacterium]
MPPAVGSPPNRDAGKTAFDPHTVLALRARQEEQVDRHQRLIERVTYSLGRPPTIYVTLLIVAVWISFNVLAPKLLLPAVDPPPFSRMQGVIGLTALLMTTMVLTTQNRQARHAEQRAHLDLEVNILSEQKIAKLIALIEELRRDMPNVHNRRDSVAEEMTRALDPQTVISALEETMDASHSANDEEQEPGPMLRKFGSE